MKKKRIIENRSSRYRKNSNMPMVKQMYFNIYWANLSPVVGREQAGACHFERY
ncbi:hypothetical protein MNB_SV-10-390 [hydrothermal vent metagenome]|uniref:Uncharacterized protein n=1 Tax=hydrothermal vent metagenome TaxID=652676 RepID=A0A1W1CGE8_9ZZZZ